MSRFRKIHRCMSTTWQIQLSITHERMSFRIRYAVDGITINLGFLFNKQLAVSILPDEKNAVAS